LVPIGLPPSYNYSSHWGIGIGEPSFVPEETRIDVFLDGVLSFASHPEAGAHRLAALSLAAELCGSSLATAEQLSDYKKQAEFEYLHGSCAWRLIVNRAASKIWTPKEFMDVLGRGLERLEDREFMRLLDEFSGDTILKPPFRDHLPRALEILSRSPQEGGMPDGTMTGVCWAMLNDPAAEERCEFMLFKSPSIALRRRSAETLGLSCGYGDRESWDRWEGTLLRLWKDPDRGIQQSVANAVNLALRWTPAKFTSEEADQLRKRFGN
jgi:hypothetical protein